MWSLCANPLPSDLFQMRKCAIQTLAFIRWNDKIIKCNCSLSLIQCALSLLLMNAPAYSSLASSSFLSLFVADIVEQCETTIHISSVELPSSASPEFNFILDVKWQLAYILRASAVLMPGHSQCRRQQPESWSHLWLTLTIWQLTRFLFWLFVWVSLRQDEDNFFLSPHSSPSYGKRNTDTQTHKRWHRFAATQHKHTTERTEDKRRDHFRLHMWYMRSHMWKWHILRAHHWRRHNYKLYSPCFCVSLVLFSIVCCCCCGCRCSTLIILKIKIKN